MSDLDTPIRDLLQHRVVFESRPSPVPPELRPRWRVLLLLVILDRCRGKRASWQQLSVLNWAIRSKQTRSTFERVIQNELAPEEVIVRYEPALTRAVDLAVGEGFAEWENGRILQLSAKGETLVSALPSDPEVLVEERSFLRDITGQVTQALIERLVSGRAS